MGHRASDDGPEHGPDMMRMLRTYVAMIATTGIRAGLEAKRVQNRQCAVPDATRPESHPDLRVQAPG
jgi:hypothetical protein